MTISNTFECIEYTVFATTNQTHKLQIGRHINTGKPGVRLKKMEAYRATTIGRALNDALNGMIESGDFDCDIADDAQLFFQEV